MTTDELYSIKELAYHLKRTRQYIGAMKKAGFAMNHNRATLNDALNWLKHNPDFRMYKVLSKSNKDADNS